MMNTSMTYQSVYQSYFHFWGHLCLDDQETGGQSGVWSCIMPGMPMHLVQELNVGTVSLIKIVYILLMRDTYMMLFVCIL